MKAKSQLTEILNLHFEMILYVFLTTDKLVDHQNKPN